MTTIEQTDDRDGQLVALLAAGNSPTQAAASIGCSATTVYRRLANEAFVSRLAVAKSQRWAPAAAVLRVEFDKSVTHMVAVRDNDAVAHSTRLRAAQAICELALKVAQVTDTDQQIAAIAAALADKKEPNDDAP